MITGIFLFKRAPFQVFEKDGNILVFTVRANRYLTANSSRDGDGSLQAWIIALSQKRACRSIGN
jgi:hypothetical protein